MLEGRRAPGLHIDSSTLDYVCVCMCVCVCVCFPRYVYMLCVGGGTKTHVSFTCPSNASPHSCVLSLMLFRSSSCPCCTQRNCHCGVFSALATHPCHTPDSNGPLPRTLAMHRKGNRRKARRSLEGRSLSTTSSQGSVRVCVCVCVCVCVYG